MSGADDRSVERLAVEARVLRRAFLGVLVAALAFGCVSIVGAILLDAFDDDDVVSRVVGTPIVAVLLGASGLTATLTLQRGRMVRRMRATIAALVGAAAIWLLLLWVPGLPETGAAPTLVRLGITLTAIGVGTAVSAQLLLLEGDKLALRLAIRVTILSLGGFAAVVVALTWTDWWWFVGPAVASVMAIWGVGTLLAVGLLPAISRSVVASSRRSRDGAAISTRTTLRMTCPSCGADQTLATGLVRCAACRFALLIDVEEPRCPCGYLLFRLEGDRCPECGRAVSAPPAPAGNPPPAGRADDGPAASTSR